MKLARILTLLLALVIGLVIIAFEAEFNDSGARADGHISHLVDFDEGQFPEGLSVAPDGTILVGFVNTGEVVRVTPAGSASILGQVPLPEGGLLVGIYAIDSSNVFGLVNSSDQTNGVWRVSQQGAVQVAELPQGLLNAIVQDASGRLLVTESVSGRIFAVQAHGGYETWAEDPLLLGNVENPGPLGFPVGVNGITLTPAGDAAYVAVSEKAHIVRIEIAGDGDAGALSVTAADPSLAGADGIDLSSDGTLYIGVNGQNQIAAVDAASGDVKVVASGTDFHFPAVVRLSPDERTLYVTNFDAPVLFGLADGPAMTGLLAIDVTGLKSVSPVITPPDTGSGGLVSNAPIIAMRPIILGIIAVSGIASAAALARRKSP